jgi:hypothetical protein
MSSLLPHAALKLKQGFGRLNPFPPTPGGCGGAAGTSGVIH